MQLLDGALLDGALLDGELLDGALLDGALFDDALLDDALLDDALLDGALLDDDHPLDGGALMDCGLWVYWTDSKAASRAGCSGLPMVDSMLHMSVDTTPQQIGQRLDDERRTGRLDVQTGLAVGGQTDEQRWLTLGDYMRRRDWQEMTRITRFDLTNGRTEVQACEQTGGLVGAQVRWQTQ